MTEDRIRPTQNVEFSEEQTRAADDRDAAPRNRDLDEITISDEAIERAMRVYSPEEAMDLLICDAPGRPASTERWQDFLVRMRAAPPTRATQRGIQEALRELVGRVPAGRC